jgi:hypothetical protein
MSSRPDSEHSAGSRTGEGDRVWSKASRRRLKPMHRVANRRRDREVDLGSKSEAGYQEQCRQVPSGPRASAGNSNREYGICDIIVGGSLVLCTR